MRAYGFGLALSLLKGEAANTASTRARARPGALDGAFELLHLPIRVDDEMGDLARRQGFFPDRAADAVTNVAGVENLESPLDQAAVDMGTGS